MQFMERGYFIGGGVLIALSFFYLMSYMISPRNLVLEKSDNGSVVDFIRIKQDSEAELKERKKLIKPPKPDKPPPPPKLKVSQTPERVDPQLDIEIPKMNAFKLQGGPFLGAQGGSGDGDIIPVVRIAPQYPRRAAMAGKEGWVKVEFTITETGSVEDARVIDSKPRRLFDRAALRAILKWKFKAKIEDGKPVRRQATQTIEFKLEK